MAYHFCMVLSYGTLACYYCFIKLDTANCLLHIYLDPRNYKVGLLSARTLISTKTKVYIYKIILVTERNY